ncbi:pantetheine-phosphate adenylyltransferase [Gemelliphila palaticanis]|uniref:Phosphopantetheine adenylyltransferase n=1 Tax=Gemelliphila palaticanis TaxID=81950 RepID=A0ABX2T1P6_9BACL|nr:pantetheine-phosphate adenylyltransferase [Gemella palaticanis]MBF0715648.1 pantetheine-phosphate adenylyltransferase [Gemella palaticanis]NYS47578.1 pantetheine-phosphate adenylyltransferase [Gemella palaticanis]
MSKKVAIIPGSFDPITNGHLDIIERSSKIFDEIIVAILVNPDKKYLFTLEERVEMIEKSISTLSNVKVDSFCGLLVNYAKKVNSNIIVRGLRAVSDFEYEMQLTSMNKSLDSNIETFYMMTNTKYSFISSSVVKGVSGFGADLTKFVPKIVSEKLEEKLKEEQNE